MSTSESSKVPKELGETLTRMFYGRKVLVKHNGVKYKGRVTDAVYSDGTIKISLDNGLEIIELDMKSYIKVFK